MDYDALGLFVLMSFVSLSILTLAVGITVRLFLGPVIRDVAAQFAKRPAGEDRAMASRLDQLDDRLALLESGIDRIEAAQDFDRRLGTVGPRKSETA